LSRVLAAPAVAARRVELAAPGPALDDYTEELVARRSAEAYARGMADGAVQAQEQARAGAREVAARVLAGVDAVGQAAAGQVREVLAARADEVVDLALAVATEVLGREPHDGGLALAARVADALAHLDDPTLRVAVSPVDADVVASALPGSAVTVVADASLAPGEARLAGEWARADLTREAIWATVQEVLRSA